MFGRREQSSGQDMLSNAGEGATEVTQELRTMAEDPAWESRKEQIEAMIKSLESGKWTVKQVREELKSWHSREEQ